LDLPIQREHLRSTENYCFLLITFYFPKPNLAQYSFTYRGVFSSTTHQMKLHFVFLLAFIVLYLCGCGSSVQHGQVIYVAEGQALVDRGSENGIHSGDRLSVYRKVKLTHPVSGEFLSIFREELAEVSVDAVRKDTSSFQIDGTQKIEPGDKVVVKQHHDGRVTDFAKEVGSVVYVAPESHITDVRLSDELQTGDMLVVVVPLKEILYPISERPVAVEMKKIAEIKIVNLAQNSALASCEVTAFNGLPEIGDVVLKVSNPKLSRWFFDIGKFSRKAVYERAYRQAIRYYGNAEYWKTIKKLKTVETSRAGYEDTLYMLAACYKHLGLFDEAERYFKRAIDAQPDDAKIWLELAYMYINQNLLEKAADAYEQLAKLQPENPKIRMDLENMRKRR